MGADTVFISYSHNSAEHMDRVLVLANKLRSMGVDVELDRYHSRPQQGWPQWSEVQLRPESSKFVLLICTRTYRDRVDNNVSADEGRGVYWEGGIINQYIYNDKGGGRFLPVLFGDESSHSVPIRLQGFTEFHIEAFDLDDPGFKALYRELTGQAAVVKPPLGAIVRLDTWTHVAAPLPKKPALSTFTPPAPAEPPTRVVDSMRGPYFKLADAISASDPGDRILVRAGTYEEALVLNKALEIINEGKSDEVIVQATAATALTFRAALGRIVNITFRQLGGDNYFAVDIVQGRVHIEGCVIESNGLAGIAVHGPEADPVMRNNRIRRCLKSGVVVFGGAQGDFEENDIAENRAFGFDIGDGASPAIRRNLIHQNEQGGVNLDGGLGQIEDNTISDNFGEGVVIKNKADPILQRNTISGNANGGIYIYDSGRSTVYENRIIDNKRSGIGITTEGNPAVRKNSINRNNGKGVWCNDHAAGVVENNDLRDNKFGAFWKSDDSKTSYDNNKE